MMHVTLRADNLSHSDVDLISAACAGWGRLTRVGESDPRAAEGVLAADVVVGWADPALLRDGRAATYLCGSAGIDAYVGHGLGDKPNFRMTNAAGTMGVTIAEHCLAMMFTLTRQMHVILRQQDARRFERRWHGDEVAGSRACIVGLGGSGTELARRLAALDVGVAGVRRRADVPHPFVRRLYPPDRLADAVADADHVFCLLPGGPATRRTFDASAFAAMKPGARFYSASRGSVTDEAALAAALRSGHLAGAALDVFEREPLPADSPLWAMDNVIVSPHSAGHSNRLAGRLAELFADNLHNLRDGRPLRNSVDPSLLG
jgi:phosphoglycerate dehydrogenase-like enzyme